MPLGSNEERRHGSGLVTFRTFLAVWRARQRGRGSNGIPDALPSPESNIDLKQWIGCLDEAYGPHIKNEYREFVVCVSALIASGQTPVNSAMFWESKSAVWPRLHKVALWHLNTPVSSLSAERAFAKLRDEDLPKRASALHATVAHELCFRYNRRILDGLLKSALHELRALS